MLAGWLFNTARFASRNALRREIRRQTAEREAIDEMIHSAEQEQSRESMWKTVEPLLHDGIAALDSKDREAVLLRFFEGRSLREVGVVLGTSEDTARKRVERALEKLKLYLKRHGVTVSIPLLAGLLTERAVGAVPASCAAAVTGAVSKVSGAGVNSLSAALKTELKSSNASIISKGVVKAMIVNKVKVAVVGGVALLLLGGAGGKLAVQRLQASNAEKQAQALVQAESARAKETFRQVLNRYKEMSSFSMSIEHHNREGLFPGNHRHSLQWRKGGRFELLVTSNNQQGKVPNYYANGEQVVTVYPDGTTGTESLAPRGDYAPGWGSNGGVILGMLQRGEEAASVIGFLNPPNMETRWKFGPRTEWHGQKVRELLLEAIVQTNPRFPSTSTFTSVFISEDEKSFIGWEANYGGQLRWVTCTNQRVNPDLPTTLGDRPMSPTL